MNEICTLSDTTTFTLMGLTLLVAATVAFYLMHLGEKVAARQHAGEPHKQRNAAAGWTALSVIVGIVLWGILLGGFRNYLCSL